MHSIVLHCYFPFPLSYVRCDAAMQLFAKLNVFGNKNKADESSFDAMSPGPRRSGRSKASGMLSWLVPGFTELKFNAAEVRSALLLATRMLALCVCVCVCV